jgi:hypothetical protein
MITVNIDKAKVIAHVIRRDARAYEFLPHDELIAKQIPGADTQAAEAQRQQIREKYTVIQQQVDAATQVETLTQIIDTLRTELFNG